jgi:hypothetical protein
VQAVGRYHAAGKLFKALLEDTLCMVAGDNGRIVGNAIQCGCDRLLRNALGGRFPFEAFKPGGKIAVLAIRGDRGAKR